MGLFGRTDQSLGGGDGSAWSWPEPIDPATMPPPSGIDVEAVRDRAMADAAPAMSAAMDAALGLALHGDPAEAESALLALTGSDNTVDAWTARLELGTLLMDDESGRLPQGLGVLAQCLQAPFSDVVGHAAWNIAEVLSRRGTPEAAAGYVRLSVDLGNTFAMVVLGERALDDGDADRARRLWQQVCAEAPRSKSVRTRAEVQLANLVLASADDELRDWFLAARAAVPAQAWAQCVPLYRNPGAMFNVEAGAASIATRYFPECPDQCYFGAESRTCPSCGRDPQHVLQAAAGRGDGVYPVLSLIGPGDAVTGALALFKDGLEALSAVTYKVDGESVSGLVIGVGSTLAEVLSAAAPLVLGTLDSDGVLLFSDASRCIDDRDYTVDIQAPPGEYTVVAWVTVPIDDSDTTLRPLALGAFRGEMQSAITDCLPAMDAEQRDRLIGTMWGRPDLTVFAHVGNVRVQLAQGNHDADAAFGNDDRALSWYLQLAEFDDAGTHDLLRSLDPLDDRRLRELLAQRGVLNPRFPWRDEYPQEGAGGMGGLSKESSGLSKTSSGLTGTGGGLGGGPPGVDPALVARAEAGDIFGMNDLGSALAHAGQLEEGLTWLERSARAGVPWAMASFSWWLLLTDDPARAVALFDQVHPALEAFVQANVGRGEVGSVAAPQLANARSNDALCRLALGGSFADALATWSAGRWQGHVESKFYPAVVAYREGRLDDARAVIDSLTAQERAEILSTVHEVIGEGTGWFAAWSRDGLAVLEQLGTPVVEQPPQPMAGEARFCINCGTARIPGGRFCSNCGSAF